MYNKEKLNQIISEKSVIQRVEQIADEISRSFEGEIPILVSVLNGSFIFTSDLVRAMKIDCEFDFIKVSTYFGDESKGRVDFQKDISIEITNRHIIIVEDIIDSGLTINFIRDRLYEAQPKSISVVTILMKPDVAKIDFEVNWVGFEIPPNFVVGYGLDYNQKFSSAIFIIKIYPAASIFICVRFYCIYRTFWFTYSTVYTFIRFYD